MRVDLLTREYPPHVYGGAGVHVTELARVLRRHVDLRVLAFDGPRVPSGDGVIGFGDLPQLAGGNVAVSAFGVNLEMVNACEGAQVVHSHTWYTNLAGFLAQQLYGVPLVVSAHSLEPLRPWKAEQLGGGYALSSFAERTAYESADAVIAVSTAMAADVARCYPRVDPDRIHVIRNGIDPDDWRRPQTGQEWAHAQAVWRRYGIDPDRPTVAFVGRVTRQKGLSYLLRAMKLLDPETQLILCAGAADTPQLGREIGALISELQAQRTGVIHIPEMLEHSDLVAVLCAANVFATPSIYEPLGIVNLEAMGLELPVVATRTGGIPDVVVDGRTGYLVPIDAAPGTGGVPADPNCFVLDFAQRLQSLLSDPLLAAEMGRQGRLRVQEDFTWEAVGAETAELYRQLCRPSS